MSTWFYCYQFFLKIIIIWKGRRPPVSDEDWEEEEKRLDRQWYSIDEGFDESQNPFSGMSEEYTQRKEKELEQKKKKKVSARQRQIQKVKYLIKFMYHFEPFSAAKSKS